MGIMIGREPKTNTPIELDKKKYNIIFYPNENVDLALIKLKKGVQFSTNIQPIALPESTEEKPEELDWVTAVGWGIVCQDPPQCTVQVSSAERLQVSPTRMRGVSEVLMATWFSRSVGIVGFLLYYETFSFD